MELKRIRRYRIPRPDGLLIVPYGIETAKAMGTRTEKNLLIVPYGIETVEPVFGMDRLQKLLIVPYGIETDEIPQALEKAHSFNRTLWN